MDYGDLKERVRRKFGRRDMTDDILAQVTADAVTRAQRLLHYPDAEVEAEVAADAQGRVALPADLRRLRIVASPDGLPLRQTSLEHLFEVTATLHEPVYWARSAHHLRTASPLAEGTTLLLVYWPTIALAEDTDTVPLLQDAPDVVEYAAYVEAAHHFRDYERLPLFRDELNLRASEAVSDLVRQRMSATWGASSAPDDLDL